MTEPKDKPIVDPDGDDEEPKSGDQSPEDEPEENPE